MNSTSLLRTRPGRGYSEVEALARYSTIAPRAPGVTDALKRHADVHVHRIARRRERGQRQRALDLKLRYSPQMSFLHEFLEWKGGLFDSLREVGYETEKLPNRSQVLLNEEIERLAVEPDKTYAGLALARAHKVSSIVPRIHKSPANGIALQTSTDRGTVNLILEGGQAILIRAGDDLALQVTCNLTSTSIPELLDVYEVELRHIIHPFEIARASRRQYRLSRTFRTTSFWKRRLGFLQTSF